MKLWPWWKVVDDPESGVYELVMIAGLESNNIAIRPEEKTLYVCKSLCGYLNAAFSWSEIVSRRVIQATKEEAIACDPEIANRPEEPEEDQ